LIIGKGNLKVAEESQYIGLKGVQAPQQIMPHPTFRTPPLNRSEGVALGADEMPVPVPPSGDTVERVGFVGGVECPSRSDASGDRTGIVGYYWSGKHKRTVKGINLITLYYTDIMGHSYPINSRLYDKQENKTKNDYFIEMLQEIKLWGVEPDWVTGDSWYSSLANLKFLRNAEVGFLFGIAENRKASLEQCKKIQVQTLSIPESGLVV